MILITIQFVLIPEKCSYCTSPFNPLVMSDMLSCHGIYYQKLGNISLHHEFCLDGWDQVLYILTAGQSPIINWAKGQVSVT